MRVRCLWAEAGRLKTLQRLASARRMHSRCTETEQLIAMSTAKEERPIESNKRQVHSPLEAIWRSIDGTALAYTKPAM